MPTSSQLYKERIALIETRTSPPTMASPDRGSSFQLRTDASKLGAVETLAHDTRGSERVAGGRRRILSVPQLNEGSWRCFRLCGKTGRTRGVGDEL